MGNATKVALVALLILLVVVIARLVREDSEGPVADDGRKSSQKNDAKPGAADLRKAEIERQAAAAKKKTQSGRSKPNVAAAGRRQGGPNGAGSTQHRNMGARNLTGARKIGPQPDAPSGGNLTRTPGQPSSSGEGGEASYRPPSLPIVTKGGGGAGGLPKPRPRVNGKTGPGRVLFGSGLRGDGGGIHVTSGGDTTEKRTESSKAADGKRPAAKPPAPATERAKDSAARQRELALQYEKDRMRGGMDSPKPLVSSGKGPGLVAGTARSRLRDQPGVPASTQQRTYVIRDNDSLWKVAERHYGKGSLWPLLEKANPGVKIHPGNKLVVPPKPVESNRLTNLNVGKAVKDAGKGTVPTKPRGALKEQEGYKVYRVQRGDTLSGIAKKFYGDGRKYPVLEQANQGIRPQLLQAGAEIRVPILRE